LGQKKRISKTGQKSWASVLFCLFIGISLAWSQSNSEFESWIFKDLSKARSIAETQLQKSNNNSKEHVRALTNLAISIYYADAYAEGIQYLKKAIRIGKNIGDSNGVARATYHLGDLAILEGRYTQSVDYLNESAAFYRSRNDKTGIALCMNSLGEIYLLQGNYKKAFETFRKALRSGSVKTKGDSYVNLANYYFKTGQSEQSEKYARLAYKKGIEQGDLYVQTAALDILGAFEMQNGKHENALRLLRTAVKLKEDLNDQKGAASTRLELSRVKSILREIDSAFYFARSSYQIAQLIGATEEKKNAAKQLSELFASKNRYDSAFFYQNRFVQLNEILLKEDASQKMEELETSKEANEQIQRIKVLKQRHALDLKNRYISNLIAIFVLVILLGIFSVLFFRYRSRKKNMEALEIGRNFQEMLLTISSKYINISDKHVDETINESLSFIGGHMDVDRVYVFNYDHELQTSSNTHEWCGDGVSPEIDNLQQIPYEYITDWIDRHFNNEEMFIEDVSLLEQGPLRELLEPQGIKSLLAIPMFNDGKCIGFVGFDAVKKLKKFSDDERHLLRIFAEMLVNILQRSHYLHELEIAQATVRDQNALLEDRIAEETRKNVELTKSLADQEKLVTIGEITAGIAHDLNTPLGSVKVGLESVEYSLEKFFNELLSDLSAPELAEIHAMSKDREAQLFQNTYSSRDDIRLLNELLMEHFELSTISSRSLSKLFLQCQIRADEKELIGRFLNYSKPESALQTLFLLQNVRNMVASSKISNQKATDVVKNLRTYVRRNPDAQHQEINLDFTLKTVLSVFNHEIQKKVKLIYQVDEKLTINGAEVKLFQLWSNLIKNAIEAMEDRDNSVLMITAEKTTDHIHVHISNNGEMIPPDHRERIFDKFFSTKLDKSGTGLGLSIVRSIADDHNAILNLESSEEKTTFTISFKLEKTNG
jgi:signal transduction histidine kinase/tetratricopeptide (TPR) repeat protein